MRLRLTAVCVFLVMVAVARDADAAAAAPPPAQADVDRVVAPVIDGEWCNGIVVGFVGNDGKPRAFGYGHVSDAKSPAPGGETVFEIGSVTKAFTGVLLAQMVGRGEVALDDPVQKYLPGIVKMPQHGDQPITLAHLASHTSGLPPMPDNLAPADASDPYADYTDGRLYAFLRKSKPSRKAGGRYEYSNVGMGLLGLVLARHANKSYEELLSERVLKPLGMSETRITLDDGLRKRLAQGHNADGDPVANWNIPTLAGAGALRSTTNEMLKFIAANMNAKAGGTKLDDAMVLARTMRSSELLGSGVGLGWHLNRGGAHVWHNGETGGYHSYCAFIPEKKVGVVVLANSATGVVDQLGAAMIKLALGEKARPLALRKTVKLPADKLDRLIGKYRITPEFVIDVTRDGERLFCQATNQPRFRVYPSSQSEAYLRVVDARLTFKLDKPDQPASVLTLHQNGLAQPGPRVEE